MMLFPKQRIFLKKEILEDISHFFAWPLKTLFWTSCDVCPGFQSGFQSGFIHFITCVEWIPQNHLWCDTY